MTVKGIVILRTVNLERRARPCLIPSNSKRGCHMVRHSDSWKRLLVVGVVILGGLMLIADTAGADRMSLDLTCSTTVPATGGPVGITLTRVSNDRGQPVSIAKSGFMVHLGGVNIVGPFVVPFVLNLTAFQVKNN